MKRLVWFTTLMVAFLIFGMPAILALPIDSVPFADQPGYSTDEKVSVYGKRTVSQEFVAQEDRMDAIRISLGNPNLKNKKEIVLSLFDQDNNLVRTSTINGMNLEDGDYVKFGFAPIPESRGKAYRFEIASSEAGAEEVIYAYYSKNPPDWMGEMKYEEETIENAAMPFATFHKVESKSALIRIIYSDWLARVF